MRRELGIGRCGLACCLCVDNAVCGGCDYGESPASEFCVNKKCSKRKGLTHCYLCTENCRRDLLERTNPYAFTLFAKRYGLETLLDCLERNEKNGIIFHNKGKMEGDYDQFDDVEELIEFIKTGKKND